MSSFLADYGQWALAATGIASAVFVFATTFLEFSGRRLLLLRMVKFRFFRWWKHELTAAQVLFDLGLGMVILPSSLYIFFGVTVLSRVSGSLASMIYYSAGFTYVTAIAIWRTDATMRAKAKERQRAEEEARAREERAGCPGDDRAG